MLPRRKPLAKWFAMRAASSRDKNGQTLRFRARTVHISLPRRFAQSIMVLCKKAMHHCLALCKFAEWSANSLLFLAAI